jgi:hypothetical protein
MHTFCIKKEESLVHCHTKWLDPDATIGYYSLTKHDQSTNEALAHKDSKLQHESTTLGGNALPLLKARSFLRSHRLQVTLITRESNTHLLRLETLFLETHFLVPTAAA